MQQHAGKLPSLPRKRFIWPLVEGQRLVAAGLDVVHPHLGGAVFQGNKRRPEEPDRVPKQFVSVVPLDLAAKSVENAMPWQFRRLLQWPGRLVFAFILLLTLVLALLRHFCCREQALEAIRDNEFRLQQQKRREKIRWAREG